MKRGIFNAGSIGSREDRGLSPARHSRPLRNVPNLNRRSSEKLTRPLIEQLAHLRFMGRMWISFSFYADLVRPGLNVEVIVHELVHLKVPNHGKRQAVQGFTEGNLEGV